MDPTRHAAPQAALRSFAWITLIVAASLMLSRAFACAMPFAALAAVAATQLGRRDAILAILLAWVGNQAIGFLLLGYPHGWATFAWGGAIGLAALAAALAAGALPVAMRAPTRVALALPLAFAAYEGALFAATFVLPTAGNPFALPIVARILAINAVAFAALLALHRIAIGFGWLPRGRGSRAAVA